MIFPADPVSRHGREIITEVNLWLVAVVLTFRRPVFSLQPVSGVSIGQSLGEYSA